MAFDCEEAPGVFLDPDEVFPDIFDGGEDDEDPAFFMQLYFFFFGEGSSQCFHSFALLFFAHAHVLVLLNFEKPDPLFDIGLDGVDEDDGFLVAVHEFGAVGGVFCCGKSFRLL